MANTTRLVLVTGPARSGKSEWAERLAAASGLEVIYLATARLDPTDKEWLHRIQCHQQRRPPHWTTRHVTVELSDAITMNNDSSCLLVDSLGCWVANLIDLQDDVWQQRVQRLLGCLIQARATIILVAEETGWGLVPHYPMGRRFRDRLGNLNRKIAANATDAFFVVNGYALNLKILGKIV